MVYTLVGKATMVMLGTIMTEGDQEQNPLLSPLSMTLRGPRERQALEREADDVMWCVVQALEKSLRKFYPLMSYTRPE